MLFLSLAALGGGYLVSAPVAGALGALGTLFLCRAVGARLLVLAGAVVLLALWRAHTALAEYELERVTMRDALGAPKRCLVDGVVQRSPTWRGDALSYVVKASAVDCEGQQLPGSPVVRLYGGPRDLARGDRVEAVAQLAPVRLFRNADVASPLPAAARSGVVLSGGALSVALVSRGRGVAALIDRGRAHVRDRIEATFAPGAVGMAKALVLGESDLTELDDDAFRRSGLAHMLAVSGTHLVFAVVALVKGLTFVLVRVESLAVRCDVVRIASALGVVLALLYADFAGGSGSAWRAAWMLSAAFTARALARRPRPARVIALSVIIGSSLDPLAGYDLSFLLSLAATTGLIVFGQPWAAWCQRSGNQAVTFLATAAAATVASMIPCTPLLAMLAPDLTLAGILANVVAGPFGEAVALPLCLSHALLSWFAELEQGVALVASGALLVVKEVAHTSANASWSALPVPLPTEWHFCVLLLGAAGAWLTRVPRDTEREPAEGVERGQARWFVLGVMALALTLVELSVLYAGTPHGELRITALDVEQGDASLVDLPDGSVMLIDGGGFVGSPVDPGKRVILPVLRARRRTQIDVLVLSHPHPDHFGGLLSVAASVPIREFWDTGQGEAEGAGPEYARLLETLRKQGTRIRRPLELCAQRELGGAELHVLGPCPSFTPRANANDNSLVLRLSFAGRVALFMGDAEAEQEHHLLTENASLLDADFLKVGHHGSRTSTSPEFLAAVSPSVATISCGLRNRFGHPHPRTMDSLAEARVVSARLDRTGSVAWSSTSPQDLRLFSEPH